MPISGASWSILQVLPPKIKMSANANPSTPVKIAELRDSSRYRVWRHGYYRARPWNKDQQNDFLDKLFRPKDMPDIVLRELICSDRTEYEVFNGWQRIETIRAFFNDQIRLPPSLADVPQWRSCVPWEVKNEAGIVVDVMGGLYSSFVDEVQTRCKETTIQALIITGIGDEANEEHQQSARDLFSRYQSGML